MTRKEAERQTRQADVLRSLGFTSEEAEQLRRISMTLHRWHEAECGGGDSLRSWAIERDEDTGKPRMVMYGHNGCRTSYSVPDREAGAKKRLATILARVNVQRAGKVGPLSAYIQTDPRGAALYIIRPGDVPQGEDVGAYYNRGICVY